MSTHIVDLGNIEKPAGERLGGLARPLRGVGPPELEGFGVTQQTSGLFHGKRHGGVLCVLVGDKLGSGTRDGSEEHAYETDSPRDTRVERIHRIFPG